MNVEALFARFVAAPAARVPPKRDYVVGKTQWELFAALLAEPPCENPALRALLLAQDARRCPAPVALTRSADIRTFSCGDAFLDEALRQDIGEAPSPIDALSRRSYAITIEGRVVGYYTERGCFIRRDALLPNGVESAGAVAPIMVLTRLAVDRGAQGRGLGTALLRDAIRRALTAGNAFGARALYVHALSEEAKRFYLAHGFQPMPAVIDTLGVMITFENVERVMAEEAAGNNGASRVL